MDGGHQRGGSLDLCPEKTLSNARDREKTIGRRIDSSGAQQNFIGRVACVVGAGGLFQNCAHVVAGSMPHPSLYSVEHRLHIRRDLAFSAQQPVDRAGKLFP